MSCYRFSLILLLLCQSVFANKFNSEQCMQSSYETKIKNSGQFFGLIKNELTIKKDKCQFEIRFLKIKWLSDKVWKVDICREPIHLKIFDKASESFHKRVTNCAEKADSSFCIYWDELKENLEDYGLIYADGERESIDTAHGQTYCSYLLLKKYLDEGLLFSKFDPPHPLFEIQKKVEKKKDQDVFQPMLPKMKSEKNKAKAFEFVDPNASEPEEVEAKKSEHEQSEASSPEDEKLRF